MSAVSTIERAMATVVDVAPSNFKLGQQDIAWRVLRAMHSAPTSSAEEWAVAVVDNVSRICLGVVSP